VNKRGRHHQNMRDPNRDQVKGAQWKTQWEKKGAGSKGGKLKVGHGERQGREGKRGVRVEKKKYEGGGGIWRVPKKKFEWVEKQRVPEHKKKNDPRRRSHRKKVNGTKKK